MFWQDSRLAFDPAECGCSEKIFNTNQFEDVTLKHELTGPGFFFIISRAIAGFRKMSF
jgi:hypothetical protein